MTDLEKEKIAATPIENAKPADNVPSPSGGESSPENYEYHMSWRTLGGFLALTASWLCTSCSVSGPNSAISYMVATFPEDAANASWIANTSLFCIVVVCSTVGTFSDRYGKRNFLLVAPILSVIGSAVSGSAKNLNTIIGGQAITGVGSAAALISVASGLEIVPAKYRAASFSIMSTLNVLAGAMGGTFIFASSVKYNYGGQDGWRWGFYIQAIMFAVAFAAIFFFYKPPPTRFRREQTVGEIMKSVDFIGVFLIALGGVFVAIPLVWGGATYPWNSAYVIPFLVIGPLILIGFCIYEWKGRTDGILDHRFFWSINFPILMAFGAVDGILLYSTGLFIPNQIRALYTSDPVTTAGLFAAFQGGLAIGYIIFGVSITKLKRLKLPLIIATAITTLFCGLTARSTPDNESYFIGMITVLGLCAAALTVVPVAGIAFIVPSHLIATSNTILACARALGGTTGIAIFTAVYNSKAGEYIPQNVVPVLEQAGLPADSITSIVGLAIAAPFLIPQVPNLPPGLVASILEATAYGNAEAYKYVWICIMAASAACLLMSFALHDVPERMDDQVESALEISKIREKQEIVV